MYQHVLVGTDGSKTAQRAVARAVEVASLYGSRLTIMTAGSGSAARRVAEDAAAEHQLSGLEIDTLVIDSDPASALVDAAEQTGCDLLVTGNKGMKGARRLLGSVPNKVSHQLPCNFLIVKTT